MKLQLIGHNYRYAAEQMLSTLFPGEKPDYSRKKPEENGMKITLRTARIYTTATCIYINESGRFSGRAAVRTEEMTDETERDRLCQFIIKNAVYRAVRASGMERPPWGALTGVRPGKLMHGIIRQCKSREEAVARFETEYDVTRRRAELCYETTLATERAESSLGEKDVCLYIGIPFCPTRCAYCSFVSQATEKSMKLIEPFLDALIREIRANAEQVRKKGLRVVAIYAGGGTRALKYHGGVPKADLSQENLEALEKVRKVGGFAVNMDLIAGLPKDDPEGFAKSLEQVLALKPENITIHTLSLKRGSTLMAQPGIIPTAAEVERMLDNAYRRLNGKDYAPYYLYRQKNMSGGFENTGWTKQGYENLYNICMMEELCSILASGGGGSTKLIHPEGGKNIRITAPKYPLEYIQQIEKTCEEKRRIGEFYEYDVRSR